MRLHNQEDIDGVRTYCEDALNTALIKYIILKHKIRNVSFLHNLVRFLADNTGKLISATSISKYIKYLCDAYIAHKVERFEIRGKKLLESKDIEKVIENIIYQQLIHNGYKVQVGEKRTWGGGLSHFPTKKNSLLIYSEFFEFFYFL